MTRRGRRLRKQVPGGWAQVHRRGTWQSTENVMGHCLKRDNFYDFSGYKKRGAAGSSRCTSRYGYRHMKLALVNGTPMKHEIV